MRIFHLRKHLVRIIPRSFRRRKNRYLRLESTESRAPNSASKSKTLWDWLKRKALGLCSASNYLRVEDDREKAEAVPKGFLAVYVGRESGEESRVLVPVIYLNHPLFGELLKEAEDEFGYEHRGGIKLPCPISELEKVQTTIANGFCGAINSMRKFR